MLIDNIIAQANIDSQQKYRIYLCKANREVLREITSQCSDKSYSPQLGGADKFEFTIPKEHDSKPVLDYDSIVGKALIKVDKGNVEIGYFEIQNPSTSNNGISEIKEVTALSAEVRLIRKKIFLTEGVFKLVDNSNPANGILNQIVSLAPSWSIGDIDVELFTSQRYFDIVDTNIYELLLNDVQEAFQCVIIFDTINKTISAKTLSNFGSDSRIILSLNNLIENSKSVEMSDDIVTRLHLYGGNELTVRDVNFGNTYIQNFDYFKNTKFMSQGLIDALNNYETLVANNTSTYNNYLGQLDTLNANLITYNSDLLILQGELQSLLEQRAYLQSIGQSTSSIQTQINNKNSQITSKQNQINSTNSSITSIRNAIDNLLNILDFDNNFTQSQIEELDEFIIEDTMQDGSFLTTESMTYNESVAIQQDLLDTGKNVLARVSYPRYKIDIDVVNFLKLPEYSSWWNELKIGDLITVKVGDDYVVGIRVTGYTDNEENNNLTIQLGNRYQLDDANIDLLELIKSSISAGTNINYKKYKFEDYSKNDKNEILEFINSSIDVLKNEIVSGSNVGVNIDSTGILAIGKDANGNILPQQMRISNNAIVLTDDGFNTAKLAIGKLQNGLYGIAAEVIAGKMILGNNMIIETGNGDFIVDGNGVRITKLSINMTSTDNLKNIIIDPSNGIKIRTRTSTSQAYRDFMYFDSVNKDFIIDGRIIVRGGSGISNFSDAGNLATLDQITSTEITNNSITTPKIATGAVTADKITVNSLSAISANIGTVNAGTIDGVNINGSVFTGGQITIGSNAFVRIFNDTSLQSGIIEFNEGTFRSYIVQDGSTLSINSSNNLFLSSPTIVLGAMSDILFNVRPRVGSNYVALMSDIPDVGGGVTDVIGYNGIIASILGDTLLISADDNQIVKSLSSQQITLQYLSGNNTIEVRVNGTYRGAIALV